VYIWTVVGSRAYHTCAVGGCLKLARLGWKKVDIPAILSQEHKVHLE
jgi:hypothetical protein